METRETRETRWDIVVVALAIPFAAVPIYLDWPALVKWLAPIAYFTVVLAYVFVRQRLARR